MLSMRRASTQQAGPGLWEGVSGRVRAGEDPIVAARREVIEETGLRVRVQPQPITAYAALRQGEPMTVIVFSAIHESGEVMLSDEHDDYRWCNADELAELGAPVAGGRCTRCLAGPCVVDAAPSQSCTASTYALGL